MWWTNHTSQMKKKKKKIPGTLRRISDSTLDLKQAFHILHFWFPSEGFTLRTMGLCQKSVERLYWQSKDSYSEEQRPGPLLFSTNDSLNNHPVLESVWETVFLNVYICCFDFVQEQNSKRMPVMKTASAT